jgi:hypothetical protein
MSSPVLHSSSSSDGLNGEVQQQHGTLRCLLPEPN